MKIIGPDALVFGVDDVAACEQYLTDYNIHLPLRNRQALKPNLDNTRLLLSASRPSLLPSRFDDSVFEDFL